MNKNLSHLGGAALAATLCLWSTGASAQQVITETVTPVPVAPAIVEQQRTSTTTTTAPAVIEKRVLSSDEKDRLEKQKEFEEKKREAKKEYREEVREAAKDAVDD